jgi:Mor family transcriptional regulator
MIHDFYNDGIGIALLTKKYHLSYSTIAHILKINKEKNSIFTTNRSKEGKDVE